MSQGKVVQVIGAVVDIEFPQDAVPKVYDALKVTEGDLSGLTLEVQQQLGGGVVRGIALGSTDGLRRGLVVENSGAPINVPVGVKTLGRIMDVLGNPIDEAGPIGEEERMSIHRAAPSYEEQSSAVELLETGIKVIDLVCPFAKGGKVGLFGGAGGGGGGRLGGVLLPVQVFQRARRFGADGPGGAAGHRGGRPPRAFRGRGLGPGPGGAVGGRAPDGRGARPVGARAAGDAAGGGPVGPLRGAGPVPLGRARPPGGPRRLRSAPGGRSGPAPRGGRRLRLPAAARDPARLAAGLRQPPAPLGAAPRAGPGRPVQRGT